MKDHGNSIRRLIRDGDVEQTGTGKIPFPRGDRAVAGGNGQWSCERSIDKSEKNVEFMGRFADYEQVWKSTRSEAPSQQSGWAGVGREIRCGPESAVAIAQENGKGIIGLIGHSKVQPVIGIEIRRCNRRRASSRAEYVLLREGPVAVAEQHRNAVGPAIRHRQVGAAVGIEVAGDQRRRISADGSVDLIRESAVAISEKNRYQSIRLVQHRQLRLTSPPSFSSPPPTI